MKFEIYRITNQINKKCYIGQTKVGVYKRFQQHCKARSILGKAIRKYGADNFMIEILHICDTQEDANCFEEYYIKENYSIVPKGYNTNKYGRLVGNISYDFMIDLKPKIKKELIKGCTATTFYYISLVLLNTNQNFIIMKNRQTFIKTWNELWELIQCSKRTTQQKIKKFLESNNIVNKINNKFFINEEFCNIYY